MPAKSSIGTTAVQLTATSTPITSCVLIKASEANTGVVYVGYANTVTANSSDSTDGIPVYAGQSISIPAIKLYNKNVTDIWVIGSAASQKVFFDADINNTISSGNVISERVTTNNFSLEIAKGNVANHSLITKFGVNSDVDAGTVPEDIWNQGGAYVPPTAARVHAVVSSSASDTSAGVGARTVLLYGVNGSYARITETVTLNGTTPVNTSNSWLHIHLIQVRTVGSSGVNVGSITATAAVDSTVTCSVDAGQGQSASTIFLVPASNAAYILKIRSRMNCATASSAATVGLYTTPFGFSTQLKTQMGINNSGSSFVELDYSDSSPFIVPEKSWIRLKCTEATNNNTSIEAEYDLILVQS